MLARARRRAATLLLTIGAIIASTLVASLVGGSAGAFGKPDSQRSHSAGDQGRNAILASFTTAAYVRPIAKMDVAAGQSGEFGGTQSGLDGEDEKRMIAPPSPRGAVGAGK